MMTAGRIAGTDADQKNGRDAAAFILAVPGAIEMNVIKIVAATALILAGSLELMWASPPTTIS